MSLTRRAHSLLKLAWGKGSTPLYFVMTETAMKLLAGEAASPGEPGRGMAVVFMGVPIREACKGGNDNYFFLISKRQSP